MSKIARYQGNVRAFASDAQGMERTVFGGTNQADDLTSQITASFLRGWGIVGASEHPSLEDFNAAMYAMSQFIAYQHQMGVPEWHAQQEYHLGSICTYNGESYQSLQDANVGSPPQSAKWTPVLTSKNGLANLGLGETAKQAAGAVQKTGDEMNGKLTLPQTSSFGVNTNNTLGGSSIAIGDNDTGLKGNGDGNLAFMANNVLAGYFNENELQHSKKMLTKNFQALVDNNWPEGAGGFSGQLSSEAPFSVPMVHRQNNDNNFFPLLKGKVSLESGYPVAASFGILTSGNTNFPQIAIHAKTDFDVNDKIWIFDVATGEFRAPGRITATEILLSGKSRVAPDGNLYGDVWGGWLNDFLNNNYNRKNTASLGDYGWVRDESTGFIMQWGTLGSSNGTYNFPREFPVSCFAVFVTNTNQQGGSVDNAFGYPVSKSQFFAATKASTDGNVVNGYPVAWFAIGR
ncbi:hypothetical protein DNV86_14285 [Salmonella enterica subsp. enterica serovar Richmond]|nr:hypothetical protein [Salmonella enterica subsp. enterica serovar Richmond]